MTTLSIALILPNPEQPRRLFDETKLAELAKSIKERGQLQPILVEEAGPHYIIHDGERRLRACQLLGLTTIHAHIRPPLAELAEASGNEAQERLLNALVANAQRAGLSPLEEAHAFGKLRAQGLTLQQIVRQTGINQGIVESRLLLLDLDQPLQELVDRKLLPRDSRVSRALLSIPNPEARVKLGSRLARPGITITAIVNACDRVKEKLAQQAAAAGELAEPPAHPMLKHSGPLPITTNAPRWPIVRAAAQGMCSACDLKASLPGIPEPAWALITQSAAAVCDTCSLRPSASLEICRACPGVELLKRLAAV